MLSEQLGLELGIYEQQLGWFTEAGELIPLPEEAEYQRAEQERQAKEQERRAKEQEQRQRERLEAFLSLIQN